MENYPSLISFFESMQKLIKVNIEAAIAEHEQKKNNYRSQETDKLTTALSQARKNFKPLMFNRMDLAVLIPYVDLEAIYTATRDALADNELVVIQKTIEKNSRIYLVSELSHSSGQWQQSHTALVMPDADIKTYTSILNEHKKQHLMNLLGIAPKGYDLDDNCQKAEDLRRKEVKKGTSLEYNYKEKRPDVYECINQHQVQELSYLLNGDDIVDIYDEILKTYGITHLSELPVSKYRIVFNRINEIKAARKKL